MEINPISDNGGRRSGFERRQKINCEKPPEFQEIRSGLNRRSGNDQRNGEDRRNGFDRRVNRQEGIKVLDLRSGWDRRIEAERRIAFVH